MLGSGLGAVIFNHSVLEDESFDEGVRGQIEEMLRGVRSLGAKVIVVSTHAKPVAAVRRRYGGLVDHVITKEDVGVNKGSPQWVYKAADLARAQVHDVVYVGDTARDWRGAINTPVFYLDAGWSKRYTGGAWRGISAKTPISAAVMIEHALHQAPMWAYAEDFERSKLRVLLPAGVALASSGGEFKLQDVFTYEKEIEIAGLSANTMLLTLVMASLLREGVFDRGGEMGERVPILAPYPGHKVGGQTPIFDEPFGVLDSYPKGKYLPDLLIRTRDATDKSWARVKYGRGEGGAPPGIENEMGTLALNPAHAQKIDGKRVVVLDDFTTYGMSLEWAKTLLLAAGAREVVMVAVGKYGGAHTRYKFLGDINPFDPVVNAALKYKKSPVVLERDDEATRVIEAAFEALAG